MSSLSWFTLTSLHSVAGASVAIFLMVQLVKKLPYVRAMPTRALAVILSEALLLVITSPWPNTVSAWVVLFLNGLLTASAAIGEWHLLQSFFAISPSQKKETKNGA